MALTKIKTGGITDSAITTAKINDDAVTDAKVADAITVTGAQTGITSVGTLGSTSISTSSAQTALSVTSSQNASNKRGASFIMGGSNAGMDFGIFVDAGSNVTSGSVIKGISRHASFTGDLLTLDCDTSASGATLINAKDAGTSKFIVKADGNVGIGKIPSEKFEIKGDGARMLMHSDDYEVAMMGRAGSSGASLDQGYIRLKSSGSNKVAIHSAGDSYFNGGSLGIGTANPAIGLEVHHNAENGLSVGRADHGTSYIESRVGNVHTRRAGFFASIGETANTGISSTVTLGGMRGVVENTSDSNPLEGKLEFVTNAGNNLSTKMTITGDGQLMVGKNDSTTTDAGFYVHPNDFISYTNTSTDSGDRCLLLNRQSANGLLVEFRRGTTTVGKIGAEGGDSLYIESGTSSGSGLHFHPTGGFIRPARNGVATDNVIDLGHSNQRFKDFYLSGGAYIGGTSGANYLDDYEEGYHSYSITGSGGGTWTIRSGWSKFQYTKIGRIVNVSGKFETYGYSGTRSGELRISLPFTPVPNLDENAEVSCGTIILNRAGGSLSNHMVAFLNGGQSSISIMIHNESGGTESFVQASNCDGYLEGILNITYVAGD